MKKLIFFIIPVLIISCAKQEKDILARIDGSTLTKAKFVKYIPESEYKKLSDERIKEFCENWIEQEILYLEAKKQGIDKEDSIVTLFEDYKKNLLAMNLVRREFGESSVTETEIREYFNRHENEFLYAVKLAQIVLPGYEAAKMTLDEIKAGANFLKLARERSLTKFENPDDPKVITDYLYRGTIADFAIEEIIFVMKAGEISDVIPYIQGTYLIIKLVDKKKVHAKANYSKYSAAIYNYLLSKKYKDFLSHYVDSLKTQYKITIDLSPLK
ncbi:peptidyl-prolyl cis-trans isomerase [candidate division WOR-3 bacterium]|nr:peptidyl-prolyl cis-trans isomerase [candidate division WOR-3 bacterium]